MKRIVIAVILALGLLLIPPSVSAASDIRVVDETGDGVWDDDTWEVEIYPGETKTTTITLYNSSGERLDVEVTIRPDSLDNGNLTFELDRSRFTMRRYADVTLTVEANGSATPGIYTARLRIESEIEDEDEDEGVSKLKLYGLWVNNITEDSADILWTTNRASTSSVTYTHSYLGAVEDKSYVTKHVIHLEGLEQDTTYYFDVFSRDKYKRKASAEGEFTTLKTTPPEVVEPEDIEPEDVEPYSPPGKPERGTPWGLIAGLIAAGLALVAVGWIAYLRRRKG